MPLVDDARPVVCQVLHDLEVGGIQVLVSRLVRRLASRYRFVFVCLDRLGALGQELHQEGFPVHVLGRRPGLDIRCVWRIASALRADGVRLVHAHSHSPWFYTLLARLLFLRPLPVLFTEHGRHFPDHVSRKRRLANRLLLRGKDRVVAVGEAVRAALIRNERLPAKRVEKIYNGVDVTAFGHSLPAEREALRGRLGFAPADVVILQVARFDYRKDHPTALHTLRLVRQTCPQARLLFVGDGPEVQRVEQMVIELGLAAYVRHLPYHKDLDSLLGASDFFLLTSVTEGLPLTLLEAMSAGLAVVATRVGGVAEVVEHEAEGLLAEAGDADRLAQHLCSLIADEPRRQVIAERGRANARLFFAEERMHAEYGYLYDEMLGRLDAPPRKCRSY